MTRNWLYTVMAALAFAACQPNAPLHRENGWYQFDDKSRDSISAYPVATVKEFVGLHIHPEQDGCGCISGRVSALLALEWADSTELATGGQFCFVMDDSVIAKLPINGRIENGTFRIKLKTTAQAHRLYHRLLSEKADSMDALFAQIGWEKNDSLWSNFTPQVQDSIINIWDYLEAETMVAKQQERHAHWQKDSTLQDTHNP